MSVLAAEVGAAEVVLKDGVRALVRSAEPSDETLLLQFLQALSVDARYKRFFSLSSDLERSARSACAGRNSCGLVACQPGLDAVAGHAGYWSTGAGHAELGLAVTDRFQGRGLGTILLKRIALEAARRGVSVLEMDVLAGNAAMLELLAASGLPLLVHYLPGALLCELKLPEQPPSPAATRLDA